jgi:predicted permease
MGAFWQDVRFGLRMLVKNPGFTAVAVLTLALGIGANAAIFSVLDPLLLRKLPVHNPDELVLIGAAGSQETLDEYERSAFEIYRDNSPVFSGVIASSGMGMLPVSQNGQTYSAHGIAVSGDYFSVLGVQPSLGRLLIPADDSPSAEKVLVLSFDFWRRTFNADRAVIGKTIPFGKLTATIVGVAPPEFLGTVVGQPPDYFTSLGNAGGWLTVLGRLKPGVTIEQARARLEPVFQQVLAHSSIPAIERPGSMAHLVLTPAARGLSNLRATFSLPAKILMAVVGLVLLIACSNVANLLFARGTARRKEITVRLALGAGRLRLVRQLVTESAMLAVLGAGVGLLAANWASKLLIGALSTERFPVTLKAGVDGRVILFAAFVLVISVILCGLAPALSATRSDLSQDLRSQSAGLGRSVSRRRAGSFILVAQVALSMTILAGAGLLLHSLINLETFDTGFERNHVLAINFGGNLRRAPEQINSFHAQLIARIKSLPGVRSASFSVVAPTQNESGINVVVEGHAPVSAEDSHVFFTDVSPGYFETMGITLQEGREFAPQDSQSSTPVAIINRTMARHYFGDQSALGQRLHFNTGKDWPTMEIVGVVADSKYNDLREQTPDFVYRNLMQTWATKSVIFGALDVRTSGDPAPLANVARETIRSLDSTVIIASVKTLREQVDESLHQDRLIAALCGIFSLLALALTCVGLYGTLSFSVVRRTNEIGVRMALGARPGNIFALVIGQGMRMVIVGLVIGAAGALASASLLAKLLFGVKAADPVAFIGVSVLLIVAAIVACYLPARRAMRVDPMVALRDE